MPFHHIHELDLATENTDFLIRRYYVNVIGFDGLTVPGGLDRHGGDFLKQVGHDAGLLGGHVDQHDIGHAALFGHVAEKAFQGLQTTGRGAQTDDGKQPGCLFGGLGFFHPAGRCFGLARGGLFGFLFIIHDVAFVNWRSG